MPKLIEAPKQTIQRAVSTYEAQARTDSSGTTVIGMYGVEYGALNMYGRVFVHGAFVESLGSFSADKPLPIGWMHEIPIGKFTTLRDEDRGPYLEGPLSVTTAGQDAAILAKDGLTACSIGFMPLVYQFAEPGERVTFQTPYGERSYSFDDYVMYVVKAELFECSLVLAGADDGARVTYVQSAMRKAEKAFPALAEGASWQDTAYSMALLMGGRGAAAFVDLPDLEHHSIYQRLAAAYAKYDKTPPPYERQPDYKQVAFQHDERAVFQDRYLRKNVAAVIAGAGGIEGPLSPETREVALQALQALDGLTKRMSPSDELRAMNASLRQAMPDPEESTDE